MAQTVQKAFLKEAGEIVKTRMEKLAPPYPISKLAHGRNWSVNYKIRDNIILKLSNDSVEIGPKILERAGVVLYALEYGTIYMPPRSYIRRALQESLTDIKKMARRYVARTTIA